MDDREERDVLSEKLWTAVGGLAAVGGGIAGKHTTSAVWSRSTGRQPPANPEAPSTTWTEAIVFSVVSGAVMGLTRLVARRFAARAWHRATGSLPPGLEDVV